MKYSNIYSAQEGIVISLEDFLIGINDRKSGKGIKQIDFYVRDYPHYSNCSIGRYISKFTFRGKTTLLNYRLTCILTKDHAEDYHCGYLDGKEKIFHFGHSDSRSLSQVWPDMVVTKIAYWDDRVEL